MHSILFNTLGLIDPNVGDVLIYICSVCVNVIDLFIQINLQFDSAMVDIEPEDELTRAHSCKPRINCALDNYIFKRIARPESANRSYHDPAPLAPLTDVEIHENKIMRKMRIFVEHSYADVANRFHMVNVAREWKLMNACSNHPAKLRLFFS